MTYADEDVVTTRLKGLDNDLDDDLLEMAILASDELVNSKVESVPDPTPSMIVEAANYYAAMDLLDALYDSTEGRSQTALQYEKRADSLIEKYLEQNPSLEAGGGYTRNHSNTDWYDQRRKSGYLSRHTRMNRRI